MTIVVSFFLFKHTMHEKNPAMNNGRIDISEKRFNWCAIDVQSHQERYRDH